MCDCEGIVQVFFDLDCVDVLKLVFELCNEFCIQVIGIVCVCEEKNINVDMVIGVIEVLVFDLMIINCLELLLLDFNYVNIEEVCLKYCYFDLCCLEMVQCLKICVKIISFVCCFMDDYGFFDIEILMLIKVILEGVCDYFVFFCVYKGKFYVLLQLLQLFKQLLMMFGFDCYYQIVKCFCDEDLCVDCQFEFIQIDVEIFFMIVLQVCEIMEVMVCQLWLEVKGVDLGEFLIMIFVEVECCYGFDKLDLCNLMELVDVVDLLKFVEFVVFVGLVNDLKGCVVVLCVLGGVFLICKLIDEYGNFVKIYGVKGLVYIKVIECVKGMDGINSLVVKFLIVEIVEVIFDCIGVQDGDMIFFGVDNKKVVVDVLGVLCLKLGKDLSLIDESKWVLLWVIDFLMFEDDGEGGLMVMYYLFILLKDMIVDELKVVLEEVVVNVYDMVINGYEVGGGLV